MADFPVFFGFAAVCAAQQNIFAAHGAHRRALHGFHEKNGRALSRRGENVLPAHRREMGVVQRRENVALALSPVDEKKLPVGLEIPRRGGAELRNGRAFGALRGALRVGRYGAASRRKVRRIGYDKIETFTLKRRAPVIGADGKPHETREGKRHEVTPVAISYDDGFYYLTAWNDHHANLTEYRLDRMAKVSVERDMPATRNEEITNYAFDQAKADMFGRFNGEEVACELTVDPDKVEIITDRFGKGAIFLPFDGQQVRARVKVCKSQQFFGWVASMGRAVSIAAPQSLVEEYRDYLHFLLEE